MPGKTERATAEKTQGPQLKGFDALEASGKVPELGGDPTRRGGPVPLAFGPAVLNLGRATLVTEATELDVGDGSEAGQLRTEVLAELGELGSGGAVFVEKRSEHAVHAGAGGFIPSGPISYGYLAGSHTKGLSVKTVSLKTTDDDAGITAVPATAEQLLALSPGESVAITGESKSKLFGGTMTCHLDETLADGSWFGGGPIGVDVGIEHEGITTTEVLRGKAEAARLVLHEASDKSIAGSAGIHVGFYLSWGLSAAYELGRRLTRGAETATEMAAMPIWREHSSGAFIGAEKGKGERCLMDVRLDLSRPAAQKAYEAAMQGDLEVARAAATDPDSGVEIAFAAETEIRKKVIPVSLGLFGFGVEWSTSSEARQTKAVIRGQRFAQTRQLDGTSRSLTDLTLRRTQRSVLTDHAEVTAVDGRLPTSVAPERSFVQWRSEARDRTTCRDEILREIDLVSGILGDQTPPELAGLREKVAGLAAHRLGRIGPRNEAGSTQVDLQVSLATAELARLATMDEDRIWAALAEQEGATQGEIPDWADPERRAAYDRESTDGRLEWKELSPRYLLRRHAYFDARRLVRKLQAIGGKGTRGEADAASGSRAAAQAKAIRDLIGTGGNSRRNLALIAGLLGPDAIAVSLAVDSDRGEDGTELDLSFEQVGAQLRVDDPFDPKPGLYRKPHQPPSE